MPNFKLNYFNGRGRAETIRLVFAAAGQKYEDTRFEMADWPSKKKGNFFNEVNQKSEHYVLFLFFVVAKALGISQPEVCEFIKAVSIAININNCVSTRDR